MLRVQFRLNCQDNFAHAGSATTGGSGTSAIAAQPPLVKPLSVTQSFGRCLRALRIEGNLTRNAFAERLGFDCAFVRDVELGDRALSLRHLQAVATVLEVSLEELLTGV